jgi:hypothetical protein
MCYSDRLGLLPHTCLIALPSTSVDPLEVETKHLAGRLRTLGASPHNAAADSGCSHSVYPCRI